jgi:hypothetical protein
MRDGIQSEISAPKKNRAEYAPKKWLSPRHVFKVDRSVFKQNKNDRVIGEKMKANHRLALQKAYGSEWKKHLNLPGRELPAAKITF